MTSMDAMVTRFFCPKDRAATGQLRMGYRPQIFSACSTFSRISPSATPRMRSPRATSSKIMGLEIIWLGFCMT